MTEPPQDGASSTPRDDAPSSDGDVAASSEPGSGEPGADRDDPDEVDQVQADAGRDVRDTDADAGRDGSDAEVDHGTVSFGGLLGDIEDEDIEAAPLEEVVADRPVEAAAPVRGPIALAGTGVAGFLMGTADVVPGFSGGTVALVVGIYERLIANVRQGARTLSLFVRGRFNDALRALLAIEWLFVTALLVGILAAIFTLATPLRHLADEEPALLKSVLLGLVLGAAVVAAKELRAPNPWHVLAGVVVAFGTFVGLGAVDGTLLSPSVLTFFLGGAIAVCAMILPGISGSFLLLLLGLWPAVIAAAADLQLGLLLVFGIGCVVGLAAFSTLLNWLLARFHDVVLAALIGLMVGSARVLWPFPANVPFENVELGLPETTDALLLIAVTLTAFSVVWMLGLLATGISRRRARRAAVVTDGVGDEVADEPPEEDVRPPYR